MSTITINFKNLCAFFTKNLPEELMVGLLDVSDFYDVQEKDYHYPRITIESAKQVRSPNGERVSVPQCWTYVGFGRPKGNCAPAASADAHVQHQDNVFGSIVLDVIDVERGLTQELSDEQKENFAARVNARIPPGQKGVKADDFGKLIDIQTKLYPDPAIQANPLLCQARFYFRHGTLCSLIRADEPQVKFQSAEGETPETLPNNATYPDTIGLEILVPEDKCAVLRFLDSDARDFVFLGAGDRNYYVTIENSPLADPDGTHNHGGEEEEEENEDEPMGTNHFQFFYKLLESPQPLEPKYLPEIVSLAGGLPPNEGNPWCMPGGYGDDPPPPDGGGG